MKKEITQYLNPEFFYEAFNNRQTFKIKDVDKNAVFGIAIPKKDEVAYNTIIKLDDDFILKTQSGLYLVNGLQGPNIKYKLTNLPDSYEHKEIFESKLHESRVQLRALHHVISSEFTKGIEHKAKASLKESLKEQINNISFPAKFVCKVYFGEESASFFMK